MLMTRGDAILRADLLISLFVLIYGLGTNVFMLAASFYRLPSGEPDARAKWKRPAYARHSRAVEAAAARRLWITCRRPQGIGGRRRCRGDVHVGQLRPPECN